MLKKIFIAIALCGVGVVMKTGNLQWNQDKAVDSDDLLNAAINSIYGIGCDVDLNNAERLLHQACDRANDRACELLTSFADNSVLLRQVSDEPESSDVTAPKLTEEELNKITPESVYKEVFKDFLFLPSRELVSIVTDRIFNSPICAPSEDPYLRDYKACKGAQNLAVNKALANTLNIALEHTADKAKLRQFQEVWQKDYDYYMAQWQYVPARELRLFGAIGDTYNWIETRSHLLWDLTYSYPKVAPTYIEQIPEAFRSEPPFSTDLSQTETFRYIRNFDLSSNTVEEILEGLDNTDVCRQGKTDNCLKLYDLAWTKIIEHFNRNSIQEELEEADSAIDRDFAKKLLEEDHLKWLRDREKHCATGFFFSKDPSEYYRCRISMADSRLTILQDAERLRFITHYEEESIPDNRN